MQRNGNTRRLVTDSALGMDVRASRAGKISPARARTLYSPAVTLGASEEVRIACDSALQDAGVYNLLAHSIMMGQMPLTSFMGYAALQQLQQNSLIRTLIQVPCRDMMAPGFDLRIDKRDEDSALLIDPDEDRGRQAETVARIEEAWEAHGLNAKLRECLELDGFEGGAFLFIDTGASADELKLPLDLSEHSAELSPERPLKFKVIDPINCFPGTYNASEPLGDHYFDPQMWWVLGTQVHCSRLLKFAANSVPLLLKPAYNFLGIPQAQLYWDYVQHWNQNRESANRLLNKFSLIAFKTNMGDILSGGVADDINRRMDYLASKRSNDGVLLMDNETEDIVNVTTPLSGVTDIVKQSLECLAVISHIPAVVLFGQSPQGFNATGESDLNNYANLIESRRESELGGHVQTLLDILRIHCTDCKDPVKADFRPFDTAKTQRNAQTELLKAQVAAAHIQAGLTSSEEERQKLATDRDSGYQFIDVEDVPDTAGMLPDDFMSELDGITTGTGEAPDAEGGETELRDTDEAKPPVEA